jgi:hypothetical protein
MGTAREIPPEPANLARDGLREYMLGTMRAALFSTFAQSPECVGVILRRTVAGRPWDIKLTCTYYANRDDPTDQFTRYFWDAGKPDFTMIELHGIEGFDDPADALAAAEGRLATYIPADEAEE